MVLKRAIPSFEVNETINRAWALHQRHLRESRTASLAALHSSMRTAVDELEQVDSKLYEWATEKDTRRLAKEESEMIKKLKGPARNAAEARVHGLFPREMRIPRDTPSQSGWDYSWKAPSGGVSTSRS
jgi:large subunit ribosomal protein L40